MSGITLKGPGVSVPISFVGMYSDSTPMVKTHYWETIVKHADTLVLQSGSMNDFVTAMFLVDAINKAKTITRDVIHDRIGNLIIPYVPGARQDRTNPTGDVLLTAHSVTHMINERKFGRVVILDPHSSFTSEHLSYYHRVFEYPVRWVLDDIAFHYDAFIAPDKGASTRVSVLADDLEVGFVQADKVRDVSTGKLSGFDVTVEAGKHYLVVDDICDGGGTFVGLGQKIAEQGATADLYVSHGIFSKGTDELKKYYNKIYTTDSLAGSERNDVTVLAVVEEMEKYNG